ncbi:pre-mRNA-splicing factor CWC22 homolog [Galendromus occidentalis]|uniref:Pre-mRNA-splicing factor CWC22 homolog n=1 Tax=Galendromus occidentalis TaxID=34638 RepID=A0AAJ6QYW1_9ACAR|nr:pre-mRNA-splicing factor CWC22 homolog [Galendromus occidentalis]
MENSDSEIEDPDPEHPNPFKKKRVRRHCPPNTLAPVDSQDAPGEADPTRRITLKRTCTRSDDADLPPVKLLGMRGKVPKEVREEKPRIPWSELKKNIDSLVGRVSASNVKETVAELYQEDLVRGCFVLARSIMQYQASSMASTHVYAALIAVINSKFKEVGALIQRMIILRFKISLREADKFMCIATAKFIAHLVNQQVADILCAFEFLSLLLKNPTDDSIEVAIVLLSEAGQKLIESSPRCVDAVIAKLRHLIFRGNLDIMSQHLIELVVIAHENGFKIHPTIIPELDLVKNKHRYTHVIIPGQVIDDNERLNKFILDSRFEDDEGTYHEIYEIIRRSAPQIEEESSSCDYDSDEGEPTPRALPKWSHFEECLSNLRTLRTPGEEPRFSRYMRRR